MHRVHLLGVPIDSLAAREAVERILELLRGGSHHVMTPNSEMLVEASRNPQFRDVLNASTLNLPDSAGLLWAARFTHQHLPERVTGVDTVGTLCAELGPEHPIFLLGGRGGVGVRAAEVLIGKNPNLIVAGVHEGDPSPESAPGILAAINASGAHLLLVAYGAPEQDLWIRRHLPRLSSVRVAMGVGGTFDFLAGTKKRAPVWMQRLCLEWLYRLMKEPRRGLRIWRAIVLFPFLILRASLSQ